MSILRVTPVELADRHLQGTVRPARALDLLDEAGALSGMTRKPGELREAEMALRAMTSRKEKAIRGQEFTLAFQLRLEEADTRSRIKSLAEQWRQEAGSPMVGRATVEQALSGMLGHQIDDSAESPPDIPGQDPTRPE